MADLLRVLQVATKPQRRGAEVFAHQLSAELRRAGAVVRTVYLYAHDSAGALPLLPGDEVLGGDEGHVLEQVPGVDPRMVRRLVAAIDRFEPDIIQVNGSRTVKYGACASVLRPQPRLVYRNIGDPHVWLTGRSRRLLYERLVLRRLDGVVGVSDATLAAVRRLVPTGLPIVRIPRAVDVDSFLPRRSRDAVRAEVGTETDVPVLVFVGSLTEEKRPDRLLRVFAQVRARRPDSRLWVVGDGPLRSEAMALARTLGVDADVRFLGVRADVPDLLHAADVLVLTSDTEGTPGAVLEAGAASIAVVATDVGGVRECVLDGRTGFLVDRDDEAGFAQAVARLVVDPFARKRMGVEARHHVAQHFALSSVVRDYLAFYDRLLTAADERSCATAAGD